MKTIIISLTILFIPIFSVGAVPEDWGVQTWTNVDTRYPIYRKDIVYGATPFLIDDSRDGKQNYESRALSIFRAAEGGTLLENQPVIFYIHGGGWTEGYRDLHSYMSLSLTGDKGWVTVVIDYRLTSEDVTKAGTADKAAWWPDNIEDVADAYYWTVSHIAENGGDPDKIFDFGQSAGAHLALMLALLPEYQDLRSHIKGVVAMSPPYKLNELSKISFKTVIDQTFSGGFSNQTLLDQASPSEYITDGAELPPIYGLYCQYDLPTLSFQCQEMLNDLRSLDFISYGDYLEGYDHVSEISVFATATAVPVVLVTNYMERLLQVAPADFNGDGSSDMSLFRPATGLWAIRGVSRFYFGGAADSPLSGDYNGDGTSDGGIFRKSSGLWAIRGITRAYFGVASDQAVPGDYDGDGSADIGIFRESSGLWAIRGITRVYFGGEGDNPVPGNYAGSGAKDIAVFRPASGLWAMRNISRVYFGAKDDRPVPGDYDWTGSWDAGIFRPESGLWAVRGTTRLYFGSQGDQSIGADYTGKLLNTFGIFRADSGLWAIRKVTRVYYGASNDIPVSGN